MYGFIPSDMLRMSQDMFRISGKVVPRCGFYFFPFRPVPIFLLYPIFTVPIPTTTSREYAFPFLFPTPYVVPPPPPPPPPPHLHSPMHYAKTLKLRFRVGDLDLPERDISVVG